MEEVLVVGANGSTAGLVVEALAARGVTVRGMVRGAGEREEVARRRGASSTVVADLADPASLRAATEGVDGVYLLTPAFAEDEADLGVAMVRAAAAGGVGIIVFQSVLHPAMSLSNHVAKQPVEAAILESGMDFAILRPAMFMQMLDGAYRQAVRTGRVEMPYSAESSMSYVDYRDVAAVATEAFTTDRLRGGSFDLSAPGPLDRYELARLMSAASGRTITAGAVSPADATLPPGHLGDGLRRMMEHYDAYGYPGGNAVVLEAALGRPATTLAAYLQDLGDRG